MKGWRLWGLFLVLVVVVVVAVIALAVAVISFAQSIRGIDLILSICAGAAFGLFGRRLGRPLELNRIVGAVGLATPILIAATAIAPNSAHTSAFDVAFDEAAEELDGVYAVVGESEDTTWLMACQDYTVVRMRSDLINSRTLVASGPLPSPQSISEIILNGINAGYFPPCPGP